MKDYLVGSAVAAGALDLILNVLSSSDICTGGEATLTSVDSGTQLAVDFFDLETGRGEASSVSMTPQPLSYCYDMMQSWKVAVSFAALVGTVILGVLINLIQVKKDLCCTFRHWYDCTVIENTTGLRISKTL